MVPSVSKRIAEEPPSGGSDSEFETRTNPPFSVAKVACPSGKTCHRYAVPSTSSRLLATTLEVKPSGSIRPLQSGGLSAPYGLGPTLRVSAARAPFSEGGSEGQRARGERR